MVESSFNLNNYLAVFRFFSVGGWGEGEGEGEG